LFNVAFQTNYDEYPAYLTLVVGLLVGLLCITIGNNVELLERLSQFEHRFFARLDARDTKCSCSRKQLMKMKLSLLLNSKMICSESTHCSISTDAVRNDVCC